MRPPINKKTLLEAESDIDLDGIVEIDGCLLSDLPRRLTAPRLVAAWRQPRTLPGQRQDLSRPGPEVGLRRTAHQAAASAPARSTRRRSDRAFFSDRSGSAG